MKALTILLAIIITATTFGQSNLPQKQLPNQLQKHLQKNKLDVQTKTQRNHQYPRQQTLKTRNETKQSLDSIVFENYNSSTMEKTNKYEYSYDASGNNTLEAYYNWNSNTNQWIGNSKYEYSYDASGNNTLMIYYSWDTNTNQWIGNYKEEYSYDNNSNNTLEVHYSWDINTNQWIGNSKYEYSYDNNSNNTLKAYYSWDINTNQWVGNYKEEYSYDANDNITLMLYYNWDTNTNQWIVNYKEEYSYDNNSNNTLKAYYNWDSNTNQWLGSSKYEYSYDANDNITLSISYNWDSNTNQWLVNSKDEYSYDASGNNTLMIYYSWDSNTNQWIGEEKYELMYNNLYAFNDLLLPNDFNNDDNLFKHMFVKYYAYYWNENTTTWDFTDNAILYYSEASIGITELNQVNFNLYPNPATHNVQLTMNNEQLGSTIEIVTITGKTIYTSSLRGTACPESISGKQSINLDLSQQAKGIYIVKLIGEGFVSTQKLVLE